MTKTDINAITAAGVAKLEFSRKHPGRYLTRAAIAGAFITVGTLFSLSSGAWFYADALPVAKLLSAMTFAVALILIVLLGGELFTGTNFVMAVSLYEEKVNISGVLRIFLFCYIGNLIGIVILCLMVAGSGASRDLLSAYLAIVVPAKLSCSFSTLIQRGALCNFLVCLGAFSGYKVKSDLGKIVVIVSVITPFVLMGFEHSIANMATFSLYALLVDSPDWAGIAWNMLWVTIGNIIGGGVLLGLPVWLSAEP